MEIRLSSWTDSFAEGEIHGVDPQVCVVGIGKSNANAVTAHNPARAGHYGSEEVPELEI